MSLKAKV